MLQPISETFQKDIVGKGPVHAPIYTTPAKANLASTLPFKNGQPYDLYSRLRDHAPVAWCDVPNEQGFWAITRYEDVVEIDRNPHIFSSQRGGINMSYEGADIKAFSRMSSAALNTLICMDQPHHIPFRMQHRDFFTPQYISELRNAVSSEVDRLLDKMEAKGPKLDFVSNYSSKLPLFTICEMLGVPPKDRPAMERWTQYLDQAIDFAERIKQGKLVNPTFVVRLFWNLRQMFRYGDRAIADRRANPQDDLMSLLANATIEDEPLSQDFLDGAWLLIVLAGNDTTRNSMSNIMRLLTKHPDKKQQLIDDPSLIPQAVPELLRLAAPVIYMRRTVTQDTEIAGQKIAEGEKVIMYYPSANRDPRKFENPNEIDFDRHNAREQIAFGTGPHVCLGQRIAIMQIELTLEKLLQRFPNIQVTGKGKYAANNFINSTVELEVQLG